MSATEYRAPGLTLDQRVKAFLDSEITAPVTRGLVVDLVEALAEVRASVVSEEPEGRRQFTAAYRAGNGNVISLETPNKLRCAAEKTVREFAEEDPEGPDYFVATRILPPWVPVEQGDET